jgi:hypothetical protein
MLLLRVLLKSFKKSSLLILHIIAFDVDLSNKFIEDGEIIKIVG